MKTTLLCAFVLAAVLTTATFQESPAGDTHMDQSGQGTFALARKEPEPPVRPDLDNPDPSDSSA